MYSFGTQPKSLQIKAFPGPGYAIIPLNLYSIIKPCTHSNIHVCMYTRRFKSYILKDPFRHAQYLMKLNLCHVSTSLCITLTIFSSGSALVDQLSYMHWWASYYSKKDSWYTTNQGNTNYLFVILSSEEA